MKYESLREETLNLNLELVKKGLVLFTWGNASVLDKSKGVFAIKPSGVPYENMKAEDIVVLDLEGKIVDGEKKPSSDTQTHLILYQNFKDIGSIIHTHSTYATAFAQADSPIECLGTTHADHFYGQIPVTRRMDKKEIVRDYEKNTGLVIVELFNEINLNPTDMPAVLVASHGPFVWGKNSKEAIYHAKVLEEIAVMNINTLIINNNPNPITKTLLNKHYNRKNGKDSYYGQKK